MYETIKESRLGIAPLVILPAIGVAGLFGLSSLVKQIRGQPTTVTERTTSTVSNAMMSLGIIIVGGLILHYITKGKGKEE